MTFTAQAKREDVRRFFSAIGVVAEEAYVSAEPDAMTFRGMDQSHIGLVDVAYPRKTFDRYSCSKKVQFGIKVPDVLKTIARFDKDELVTLTMDTDSRLIIKSDKREFRLHMVEGKASATGLPKLTHDVKIEGPHAIIDSAIADIACLAEEGLTIEADGSLLFTGKGDMDHAKRDLSNDCAWTGKGKATFGIDYISKIIKAVATDTVKMEYSSKKPLKISFGAGYISYFLAPKVE